MANGLFMTPEQIQEQESEQRRKLATTLGADPITSHLFDLGFKLAGQAPTLFGGEAYESPDVKRAFYRTQAAQRLDPADPTSYRKAAKMLYEQGDFEAATKVLGQMPKLAERKIIKDVTGRQRYVDTGELVFPDVEAPDPLAKAPTTRTIREGAEFVNQEWVPETRQWKEVGRGAGKGMQVNIQNAPNNWTKIFDRYEKQMKPIEEERAQVARIKTAINTPGGASNQALQTSIANLFGGQTRALAELERWATFGNLPDRVVNSASRFLTGEYSEEAKADVLRLLRNYEATGLNKKHERVNQRMRKPAEALNISRDMYETDIPSIQIRDFSTMTLEDIVAIDPTSLELDERKDLERRLTELGY